MGRRVTIGMLKDVPEKWDADRNWDVFVQQFESHGDDVDVFITPECYLDGYAVTEDDWTVDRFEKVSLTESDPKVTELGEMAKERDAALVFGCTEIRDGGFYNCALLFGRDGSLVGRYYKTHLQTHDHRFRPGQHLEVFDLDFGRVGIVICADRRWPESIRTLRLQGAEICLMPTYGMKHTENEWWMRTRSYENQMFVCFTHPSVSLITDPKGNVAAKLESNLSDVLLHTVDLSEVTSDNHLQDRRPELYGPIADVDHPSKQDPYEAPSLKDRK